MPNTPYGYKGEVIKGLLDDRYNCFRGKFCVEILNKTSQTIYIDKANSFRIEPDGSYYVYYNAQQTTVNQGGGSGGGVNLGAVTSALGIGGVANTLAGGVSVGGGKEHSVSTTYVDQRVVAIPPHGKMVLSKDEPIVIKTSSFRYDNFKMASFSEDFFNVAMPLLQRGEYRMFGEHDSPATKRYMVTYSADSDFKSAKQLEFAVYVKDVIGSKKFQYKYFDLKYALEILSGQKGGAFNSIIVGNEF